MVPLYPESQLHTEAATDPAFDEEKEGQALHTVLAVLATEAENVLRPQFEHAAKPVATLNFPAMQPEQEPEAEDVPVMMPEYPAEQSQLLAALLPVPEVAEFDGHVLHEAAPLAFLN
jgi:hypothetical protein